MILIIDSGATKADWCLVGSEGPVSRFKTSGMNFSTMSADAVQAILAEGMAVLGSADVSEVHLYAAGLLEGSPAHDTAVSSVRTAFAGAEVECTSDLPAAARAVCGRSPGIAAILGTGSNSCLFDGDRIVANVRSGGFILGDEGGGACLGKLFISDYIKGLVPEPLASSFGEAFDVDYLTVVSRVYREEAPSSYLGSFAPWILARAESDAYARSLVVRNLSSFFDRSLSRYARPDLSVGFVGGFAAAVAPYLEEIASDRGIRISKILASPMEGLVQYHSL